MKNTFKRSLLKVLEQTPMEGENLCYFIKRCHPLATHTLLKYWQAGVIKTKVSEPVCIKNKMAYRFYRSQLIIELEAVGGAPSRRFAGDGYSKKRASKLSQLINRRMMESNPRIVADLLPQIPRAVESGGRIERKSKVYEDTLLTRELDVLLNRYPFMLRTNNTPYIIKRSGRVRGSFEAKV